MSTVPASLPELIAHWRDDPVAFVVECLGADPEPWQIEVLRAYRTSPRTALCSSKGCGKTTILAWLALHMLATMPHCNILATSITRDNLRDGLVKEMAKWAQQSAGGYLRDFLTFTNERIFVKAHPETWWFSARSWPKDADATAQANTLAGLHNDYSLVLCDEVGDYPVGVVAAADASLSGGAFQRLVIAGNPTRPSGPLYNACTKDRARWYVYNINGIPENPKRSRRVDPEWAKAQIAEYGWDSDFVKINIRGEFPSAGGDTLISLKTVQDAIGRNMPEFAFNQLPKVLAVDVARYGDDTSVILARQGPVMFRPVILREMDLMSLVGRVVDACHKFKPHGLFVDQTGMGAGVVDRLKELGYNAIGIDFGGRALQDNRFTNRRAEMWWNMRDWLETGSIPTELPELQAELTTVKYGFHSDGRIKLESKDELKKRLGRSPDLADALALSLAMPVQASEHEEPGIVYNPLQDEPKVKVDEARWDYNPLDRM